MILIQILKHNKYIGGCNVIGFIGMIIVSVPYWGTRHPIIEGYLSCFVLKSIIRDSVVLSQQPKILQTSLSYSIYLRK